MTKEEWNEVLSREGKIDPSKYGIGVPGLGGTSRLKINGKEPYKRIFVRLRTPQETLTCSPIQDGADFAQRVSIIENWFNSVVRKGNFVLTFEALQITDEEADLMGSRNEEENLED